MELVIFAAFVAIQYTAKALPALTGKYVATHPKAHMAALKLADKHFIVWLGHPAIVHAVQEYAVHFVIYSGYVLRAH